jgi:hypothetical protein
VCWKRPRVIAPMMIAVVLAATPAVHATDVTVNGSQRYQTIGGFGACLIAWVGRFRELYRTEHFQRIYAEGVGCTMLRVNMWGPTLEEPAEDWTEICHKDLDFNANGGRPQRTGQGVLSLWEEHRQRPTARESAAVVKDGQSDSERACSGAPAPNSTALAALSVSFC